ncbi:MAG: hypothetical protein JSW66_05945 [Phycisphaerales bacterium]|nr:MAG: hypothetical protein JSW66_05945 [Phycisphaerales bacterium]
MRLYSCMTGADNGPPVTGGEEANIDSDTDADRADFGIMQRCFSGDVRADPNCGL